MLETLPVVGPGEESFRGCSIAGRSETWFGEADDTAASRPESDDRKVTFGF